ncbi:hypothetical protein MIR68_005838 [Amoeboaphelidium protococcarum]|nr:hypothetical protein MIR68_005838 [Amoeboaphelidium protococcarum]
MFSDCSALNTAALEQALCRLQSRQLAGDRLVSGDHQKSDGQYMRSSQSSVDASVSSSSCCSSYRSSSVAFAEYSLAVMSPKVPTAPPPTPCKGFCWTMGAPGSNNVLGNQLKSDRQNFDHTCKRAQVNDRNIAMRSEFDHDNDDEDVFVISDVEHSGEI